MMLIELLEVNTSTAALNRITRDTKSPRPAASAVIVMPCSL